MNAEGLTARLQAICHEFGLEGSIGRRIADEALTSNLLGAAQEIGPLHEENRRLLLELQETRAEAARLRAVEKEIMKLLGAEKPERIVHEIRNVLNRLALRQAEDSLVKSAGN